MRMSINWVHWSVWLATLTKFPWHQALREGAPWKQSKQAETHDELAIANKNWKPCGAYGAAKERDAAEILSYFGEPPAPRLRGSLASLQEGSFGRAMVFAAVWLWPVFIVKCYAIMGAPTIYRFSHWQDFLVNVNTFAKHFACAVREAE